MASNEALEDVVGLTEAELETLQEVDADKTDIPGDAEAEPGEAEGDEGDEAEVANAIPEQFTPEYKVNGAENLDETYQTLESSYTKLSDELDGKYESGELSFSEYRKEIRELDSRYIAEKSKLDTVKLKAEIATEQSKQTAEQKWQWEQDTFFRDNTEFKSDPVLFGALNSTLQAVFADPSNAGKTGLQMIRLAADQVRFRIAGAIPNSQQKQPDKAASKQARTEVALPKTLSNLPAAESNSEGGEFDYLDKLQGLAYENAIRKLSPDQLDKFLAN